MMIMLSSLAACSQSTTEKALEYADDLQDAITEFEESRSQTAEQINEMSEDTIEMLAGKAPDLRDAARAWEKEWGDVSVRFKHLEDDFSEVAKTSKDYFAELEALADKIQNTTLQNNEKQKNARLKATWIQAFRQASKDLDHSRALIQEGNDVHLVLLGASLREKLTQNIKDLKNISQRAQTLLSDLKRLTEEGRKLSASN